MLPGSLQLLPSSEASVGERFRQRIAVNPSPTVGSIKVRGAFLLSDTYLPSARNAPPEQKALVSKDCEKLTWDGDGVTYCILKSSSRVCCWIILSRIGQPCMHCWHTGLTNDFENPRTGSGRSRRRTLHRYFRWTHVRPALTATSTMSSRISANLVSISTNSLRSGHSLTYPI